MIMAKRERTAIDSACQLELLHAARSTLRHAYAPYSRFRVGAALLADDGTIFTGVNVENVSYGLTICAERAAVFVAVAAAHRRFGAIAIASDPAMPCMPCGACRQVLAEFGCDLLVVVDSGDGGARAVTLSELLPEAFSALPDPG